MINKERFENLTQEIWKGAIKLRGKFKAKDYPSVILLMIMIRRIECVLEAKREQLKKQTLEKSPNLDNETLQKRIKIQEQNEPFYNTSNWTLKGILDESSSQVEANFRDYLNSYSSNIDDIIDKFDYRNWVTQMVKASRLGSIIRLVAEEDLSPQRLSNIEMGYVYENLLQLFSQDDAKDTGEHFTPREIIRIMVELMEIDFNPETATKAISAYDPACGTGGMLSITKEQIAEKAKTEKGLKNVEDLVLLNGQELLPQNYALCKADMIIKGESHVNITHDNSLIPEIQSIEETGDLHAGAEFDGKCTGEILAFEPFRIKGKVLMYLLASKWFIDLCNSMAYEAKMPRFNWNTQLAMVYFPLPSKAEQESFVQQLDILSEKTHKLKEKLNAQITTLQAYRKSLIHECVMGKKQVWEGEIENVN